MKPMHVPLPAIQNDQTAIAAILDEVDQGNRGESKMKQLKAIKAKRVTMRRVLS